VSLPFTAALVLITALAFTGLPMGIAMITGSILYLLMRGQDMGSPERSRAATARPRRICDAAIEKRIATADPNVNHRAARDRKEGDWSMEQPQYDRSAC